MWETLQPWSQATDGCFGGPWCMGTRGVFCPGKRVIVSPAPTPAEAVDRRRYERDRRDITDILAMLGELNG